LKLRNSAAVADLREQVAQLPPSLSIYNVPSSAGATIKIVQGNIIASMCDAIVNGANETLEGGGGVDFAIH
jgi:hypothetical protein